MSLESQNEYEMKEESFETVVIGGGQAGLAVSQFLAQQGEDFVILDQHPRTGDVWRYRWDSLRLFTPSQFNSLPGMPFPGPVNYFPTKDEVADYLEAYARRFELPVRTSLKVDHLSRDGQGYQISAGLARFKARKVIVATGAYQTPIIPALAGQLDPLILQLHSNAYHNPQQIPVQSVLVVGAGNSGAEIAYELALTGKKVWLAGRDVGRLPLTLPIGKLFNGRLVWWIVTHIVTVNSPIGSRMKVRFAHHGAPLGRLTREEVSAAGVQLSPRMSGTQSGKPQLEDGRTLEAEGVIWATGFRPEYRWIDLPILDETGFPKHVKGAAQDASGVYFVGLPFQTGLSSPFLGGVGKDAAYIAKLATSNSG